ncbi:MAG: hypothetical protein ABIR46_02300 [Candidatus Saccharimonadales bacterium]
MESTEYIPGICNINKAEIAYRRKAMIIGYFIAGLVFAVIMVGRWSVWVRALLVFLPLYVGVINNLQVRNKFCVSYAASGRQNATDGDASASDISDEASRQTDKAKARTMNLQALGITVLVLAISLLIPAL